MYSVGCSFFFEKKKFERITERKGDGESKILYLWDDFLNDCSGVGWMKPNPGARSFGGVSHMGGRVKHLGHLVFLSPDH